VGIQKGEILQHATSQETLARDGRNVKMERNQGRTYRARRFINYGATTTNSTTQNRYFQNGTGDRSAAVVQAHQTQEGVTVTPDNLTPIDFDAIIQQYSCLYGYTDVVALLHEDDIPAEMKRQNGERVAFVNEQILYGILRGCTNVYYGGTGTTMATVNGKITLTLLNKIAVNLVGNHAKPINKMLSSGPNYGTDAVFNSFNVYVNFAVEPDVRALDGFVPVEKYAESNKSMPNEIGKAGRFRFIIHADLPEIQDAGAAIGATNLKSTTGVSNDVFPIIVVGQDAFSQISVRGAASMMLTFIPVGTKSPADPFGQRGYVGAMWWKTGMIENHGWMAVANVGITSL
jgi:N4-gp56 family major capsid protein